MINDQSNKMATELPTGSTNGQSSGGNRGEDKFVVKTGLARMLKGGVIMDVVNAEQVCPLLASFLHSSIITKQFNELWLTGVIP